MSLIEVKGLKKSYGDVHAVRGLDLEIAQGEIFSLLGPNGAGKTTTVEILEGFRTRDSGTVSVLGLILKLVGMNLVYGEIASELSCKALPMLVI